MAQQESIRDLYENEEVSLRELARRTNLSFQTVQRYAYKEDWSRDCLPNLEAKNYPSLEEYIPAINQWMEADRKSLLTLPEHPFPAFRYEAVTVNKCGFATMDTNKYVLALALAGRIAQAKLFFDHMEFYHDYKLVRRYVRSYEREQELCD